MHSLAIISNRILTPEGIRPGVVLIDAKKIKEVGHKGGQYEARKIINVKDDVVMPGLIDPHVHVNEPGRTEWEGFDTATKAAAASGITTIIDMPLNSSPVTTNVRALEEKILAAKKSAHINCGFYGGVIPGNLQDIPGLLKQGVFGLKAFLIHSGIDEFPNTPVEALKEVLLELKKYDLPLLVHCELDDGQVHGDLKDHPTSYQSYLQSRPRSFEDRAIEAMIDLCRQTKARVHIVHLSSTSSLPAIRAARKEGIPLTVETAPHYLFFHSDGIADGNTLLKCAPPIRKKENCEKLWEALNDGTIDFVATDHSPAPLSMKETESGNFEKAWGGIAGLQFSLPAVWKAASERGFNVSDISRWMSSGPAKFLNLTKKGCIESGADADIVIWDPEKEISISQEQILHRHKISPYTGLPLKGEVKQTIVHGKIVFDKNTFPCLDAGEILLNIDA